MFRVAVDMSEITVPGYVLVLEGLAMIFFSVRACIRIFRRTWGRR